MSNRKFVLIFFSPYIFIILCLLIAQSLSPLIFKGVASERELQIAEFPFSFEIPEIKKTLITENLRAPINIPKKEFPRISLERLAPPPGVTPKITLVMIGKDSRLAIINGLVLKEGDAFGNGRVLRIRGDAVVVSEMGNLKEIPVPAQ